MKDSGIVNKDKLQERIKEIIKKNDTIELKHFNMLDFVKTVVLDIKDDKFILNLQIKEGFQEAVYEIGDSVVMNILKDKEIYLISAEIVNISNFNCSENEYMIEGEPNAINLLEYFEITVKVNDLDSLKNLRKSKRYYVSYASYINTKQIKNIFGVVKNISMSGIKISSKGNADIGELIEVTINIDKVNRLNLKGKVVRKNKYGDIFEYGIETTELSGKSQKIMNDFLNKLESVYTQKEN